MQAVEHMEDQALANQYLTFMLDGEEYGTEILKVRGIQGWEKVTPIPSVPDYVLGVINLRGDVVPIIDLRRRFELDETEFTARTVVVIVQIEFQGMEKTVGIVVDAVAEVYSITNDDKRSAPEMGESARSDLVSSLALIEGKMVILLDIDHLVDWGVLKDQDMIVAADETQDLVVNG